MKLSEAKKGDYVKIEVIAKVGDYYDDEQGRWLNVMSPEGIPAVFDGVSGDTECEPVPTVVREALGG